MPRPRPPSRSLLTLLLVGVLRAVGGGLDARAEPPPTIDAAIERAVRWIEGEERAGAFGTGSRRVGHTVLAAFALVHAGADPTGTTSADRTLRRALLLLEREGPCAPRARDEAGTYETALMVLLLRDLGAEGASRARMAELATALAQGQAANGQWSYGLEAGPRKASVGDNSNAQLAVLALGAAVGEGLDVPAEALERARTWWLSCAQEDGGFAYASGGSRHGASTGSMTAAGIASLAILDEALGTRRAEAAIGRAVQRLAEDFEVDRNFGPAQGGVGERQRNAGRGWLHYFLWSVERAMVLAGHARLGVHDWYAAGVAHLLDTQKRDGSWRGEHPLYATCFALLFLTRAADPPRAFTPPSEAPPAVTPGDGGPAAPPAAEEPAPRGALADALVRGGTPAALVDLALREGAASLLSATRLLGHPEPAVRRRAFEVLSRLLPGERVEGADRHPLPRGRLALWLRRNARFLEARDGRYVLP